MLLVELLATTSEYNSKFKSFSMYDDGTNGDLLANDGVYSAFSHTRISMEKSNIILEPM